MPLPPSWHSLTGNVTFTFSSDPIISGNGFSLSIAFVECATYGFVIEDIGVVSCAFDNQPKCSVHINYNTH